MVCVQCRNVRHGSDGRTMIVGVLAPQMWKYLERSKSLPNDNKDTDETKKALGSIERDYDGPGGQKITRAKFLELTTQGCGNCLRDIEPSTHGAVTWVGTPPTPICHECNSPQILETLGFPEHLKLVH